MEAIGRFVENLAGVLANRTVVRRRMSAIGRQCGRARLTTAFLSQLDHSVRKAGVHTDTSLASASTLPNTIVRFSRQPFSPSEVAFGCESQLVDLVVDSVGKVPPLKDLKIVKREFSLPSGRRVDLLCKKLNRSGKGDLVAVEFKKGEAGAGAVEQLANYLDELRSHRLASNCSVRGILLARRIRLNVAFVVVGAVSIELFEYSFAFTPVPSR